MFKRIIAIMTCLTVMFALTACGAMKTPYDGEKLEDYIKLGKYKGLKYEKQKVEVTDKEVEDRINSTLQAAAKTEDKTEGNVAKNDTVSIDFEGTINGKKFDGGTAKGATVTVGSGQFIEGFEDGLIGMKVGENKTLKLKFPKDYSNTEVAGKNAEFKVTVNSIKIQKVPTIEEYVEGNDKYKSVEEFKKENKKVVKQEKEKQAKNTEKEMLFSQVVQKSTIKKDKDGKDKYPEGAVEDIVKKYTKQYKDYAKQSGMPFGDFLKKQMGMSEKEFNKAIRNQAENQVKNDLVVYAIAEKEGIKVKEKEYKEHIKTTLESYGYDEKSFKEATGQSFVEASGGENVVLGTLFKNKVLDFIHSEAKVKDK